MTGVCSNRRGSRRPHDDRAPAERAVVRRAGPRPIAFALDGFTQSLAPATLLAEVQRAWPEAAGRRFAPVSEPVREHEGVVTVACTEAVWAQELDLMSELVVNRLNAALGRPAVRRLRVNATRA
jgi:predicted nucleic acid-binding Zn ribbon protein